MLKKVIVIGGNPSFGEFVLTNKLLKLNKDLIIPRFNKFNMPTKNGREANKCTLLSIQNGLDFYGIKKSVDEWIAEVETEVKKYTNRS